MSAESEQVEGLGAVHLAHGGTIILRNLDRLEADDQQVLAGHLARSRAASAGQFPDIRVIATARHPARLVEALKAPLGPTVELPPLAQRRRDILPLARHLVQETAAAGKTHQLTKGAEHALLARTYKHRNVGELKEVVELATLCAGGNRLRAEHIFSGLSSDDTSLGWTIPGQELLKRLLRRGWLRGLRALVLVSFCAVIGLCLVVGERQLGRFANGFIWSVWEPLVFALFLLVGSVWCTVCPLSTAGQ